MPAEDELAALKRELDDVRDKLHDVRAEQQRRSQELVGMLRSMGLSGEEIEEAVSYRINNHGMTRRAALVGIVGTVAAGSYLAGTERARADSTGQLGTASDPLQKIITDSVEAGDVAADTVVISGVQSGTETFYLNAVDGNDRGTEHVTKTTPGVSTTATSIFDAGANATLFRTARLLVYGVDDTDVGNSFLERVIYLNGQTTSSIPVETLESIGSPAGRTYTRDGQNIDLAMASGTYNITVQGVLLDAVAGD